MTTSTMTDEDIVNKYLEGVPVKDIEAGNSRVYRVLDRFGIARRTPVRPETRQPKQPRSVPGRRPDGCTPIQSVELYIAHEPRSRLRAKLNRIRVEERLSNVG